MLEHLASQGLDGLPELLRIAPDAAMRAEAADIRGVFNASSRPDAESLLRRAIEKDARSAPRLATWLEENLPEGLTVFAFPAAHRRLLRTTNGLERLNLEIRRRTRVVGVFPNPAACLRLVSAVTVELSDDWYSGRAYLTFDSV